MRVIGIWMLASVFIIPFLCSLINKIYWLIISIKTGGDYKEYLDLVLIHVVIAIACIGMVLIFYGGL